MLADHSEGYFSFLEDVCLGLLCLVVWLFYLSSSRKPDLPNNVLSMTQLKTKDLPDQVKALLINGELYTPAFSKKITCTLQQLFGAFVSVKLSTCFSNLRVIKWNDSHNEAKWNMCYNFQASVRKLYHCLSADSWDSLRYCYCPVKLIGIFRKGTVTSIDDAAGYTNTQFWLN